MASSNWPKSVLGSGAVFGWFLLFAVGMLIDSKPYRETVARMEPPVAELAPDSPAEREPRRQAINWQSFAVAALAYTPLNVALLTLLAGLAGGCASNLAMATRDGRPLAEQFAAATDERERRRLLFLSESPFAATFRSFAVYLAVIAGAVITGNQPFSNTTADQYVRLAGTVSAIAFMVGYDPTRFEDFLNLLPAGRPRGGSD